MIKKIFHFGINLGVKITGLSEQFILFLVMGFINTLFYYSLYSLLIFLNLHYSLAVIFATVLGVIFNFHTFGKVVFKDFHLKLLPRFIGVYIVVCCANVLGLKGLEHLSLDNKYLAGAVLVLPVALLGYVLNKMFVFNQKKKKGS